MFLLPKKMVHVWWILWRRQACQLCHHRAWQGQAPDLICTLRAKTAQMKVVAYQRAILSEALYYLVEHLTLHAHSISFPELAFPSMAALTALKKEIKMVDWHQEVRDVIREVEKNMNFIRDRRRDVTFGPKDTDKCVCFFFFYYDIHSLMFGGYPPTAIGYPPTAIGYPPTAIGYPPAAIVGRIGHYEFFFFHYGTPCCWSNIVTVAGCWSNIDARLSVDVRRQAAISRY